MKTKIQIGQRCISTMEPDLGLGIVTKIEPHKVEITFRTSNVTRFYSIEDSPLKRISLKIGETVKNNENLEIVVEEVHENDGLLSYTGKGLVIHETDINDATTFVTASERLASGHVDPIETFSLRTQIIEHNYNYNKSRTKGFVGPRINILPHQLYIAEEAITRQNQRLLLSDEVGLGKTIEACLIMHNLLLTKRIERVLIIVPDSLIYQWFVELLRKFNLSFTIFDKECITSLNQEPVIEDLFSNHQFILTSMEAIFSDYSKTQELINQKWDLAIIDEIHHVSIDSPEYDWLEKLAKQTKNILALTATPEVLGYEGVFTICKLLYPEVYNDYEKFITDAKQYTQIADIIEKIETKSKLTKDEVQWLSKKVLVSDTTLKQLSEKNISEPDQNQIIQTILDGYGLGHIIFRNTRKAINYFSNRQLNKVPLTPNKTDNTQKIYQALATEFDIDNSLVSSTDNYNFKDDLRIRWLLDFLKTSKSQKVLLICHTKEKAIAISQAIKNYPDIKMAMFHEKMTLIQRDRMAHYFSEEDGAQLMICSEIGSEGRNFQFASHLVLFDTPLNLNLLEQRIGRLDRIGQEHTVNIYMPYIKATPQDTVIQWLIDGCTDFSEPAIFGNRLTDVFKENIIKLAKELNYSKPEDTTKLKKLIKETQITKKEIIKELESGRDRLLERSSYQTLKSPSITEQLNSESKINTLDIFMCQLFDHFGIEYEEVDHRTYYLKSHGVCLDMFTDFKGNKMVVTFDRTIALKRENILFLTWDSPMVRSVSDLFIASEKGNASIANWENKDSKNLYLEVYFIVDCVAANQLHIDRFLPPQPIRVLVDFIKKENQTAKFSTDFFKTTLSDYNDELSDSLYSLVNDRTPDILQVAEKYAKPNLNKIIEDSTQTMSALYTEYINRYEYLHKINHHIQQSDIDALKEKKQQLKNSLKTARLRLDTVRLIIKGL
jgi:ATP-dependent helicase HepA